MNKTCIHRPTRRIVDAHIERDLLGHPTLLRFICSDGHSEGSIQLYHSDGSPTSAFVDLVSRAGLAAFGSAEEMARVLNPGDLCGRLLWTKEERDEFVAAAMTQITQTRYTSQDFDLAREPADPPPPPAPPSTAPYQPPPPQHPNFPCSAKPVMESTLSPATRLVNARAAMEDLERVLCDMNGDCCIKGSQYDRNIVDASLSRLRAFIGE